MTAAQLETLVGSYVNSSNTTLSSNLRTLHNLVRKEFCRKYFGWDFLKLIPAAAGITTLPASTYSSYDGWYKTGWLVVQPNTIEVGIRSGNTTPAAVKCQAIDFIREYDFSGNYLGTLNLFTDNDTFMRDAPLSVTGTPTKVLFYNTATISYLRFLPRPNQTHLYAVQTVQESLTDIAAGAAGDVIDDALTSLYYREILSGLIAECFFWLGEDSAYAVWNATWNKQVEDAIEAHKVQKAVAIKAIPFYKGTRQGISGLKTEPYVDMNYAP